MLSAVPQAGISVIPCQTGGYPLVTVEEGIQAMGKAGAIAYPAPK